MDASNLLEQLREGTNGLVRTVDGLTREALEGPSLLPGWSRAHVVAHLALNAEGLADAVRTVRGGGTGAMYPSAEARDADIEELATATPDELRSRLYGGSTELAQTLADVPDDVRGGGIERVPGSGVMLTVGEVPFVRWREVEIHHVDLAAAYAPAAWTPAFTAPLVDSLSRRPFPTTFTVVATDLDRSWTCGPAPAAGEAERGAPEVRGLSGDLGWWLSGRGHGEGLSCDGDLPDVPTW